MLPIAVVVRVVSWVDGAGTTGDTAPMKQLTPFLRSVTHAASNLLAPWIMVGGVSACTGPDGEGNPDTDSDAPTDTDTDTDPVTGCTYPEGAVEPMALNEVLSPYSWPNARHRDGVRTGPLDLANVPCATDPDIDWSPFDVLLFVSIPAW